MAEEKEIYKAPEFSLTPILNPETKEYSLKHFEEVKEACEGFIEENTIEHLCNDDDLRTLKKCRTNIRKKKDQIKSVRVSLTKLFSFQFKELESLLDEADTKLKQLKDEFEASRAVVEEIPEVAPVVETEMQEVTLVLKYRDANIVEQIKKLAADNGCEIIVIKETK